ncbi:hypothetical protein FLJC2902T_03820 [Flavobacterium limnosediminis JC2902]|uniref:Carboxypeptidase-like regulatory domain-containing protein n=1 Tax=Flavobacterium limnosediminis JC2902 TaxID=1341181 RepID=V6SUP4_9FLAO|nr:hypothetical protein [Flavobacterium limnosediminis]ESU29902.1 hypothetical protein FLJC2902T_03820 [Flavobacterium limnosediminis JC2902]
MYKTIGLFLFFCNLVNAQVSVNIFNSVDKKPVAYASVWKDKNIYKTADSIGHFVLDKGDTNGEFKISAIGFHEKIFKIEKNESEIFLEPKVVQLEEVKIVKRKHKKNQKLGKARGGDSAYAGQYDSKSCITAKFFPNNGNMDGFLKSIKFKAGSSEGTRLLNVHFYSVDENGAPGEPLYNENLICKVKEGTRKIHFEIDDLNIMLPEDGLFVVLETLLLEQNKQYYKGPGSLPTSFIYEPYVSINFIDENFDTWFFEGDKWHKNTRFSVNMELVVSD